MTALPQGFSAHVAAIGIKDDTDDFLVLAAERTTPAAGRVHPQPIRGGRASP